MKRIILFICVCLSLLISCRKQIKPEVVIVKTETPMKEVKTDSIIAQDTRDSTSFLRITDTSNYWGKMWENRFGGRNVKKMIEELKTEKDHVRREDIIFELGYSYDTMAIQPIIEILQKDKWAPVRRIAASALGPLGLGYHGYKGEAYVQEFVKSKFGEDRLKVLLSLKEKLILPALKNALNDKDINVVFWSASELVALGDTNHKTLQVLLDIFRKESTKKTEIEFKNELSNQSLEILKRVGNQFVIDGLTESLKDKDALVRENAKQALEALKKP
jgi:HEAT repeat protein